jgi:hypothetical protein
VSFFATVAGQRVVGGSLLIPSVGLWTADLQLAGAAALAGQVMVTIGNLSLLGTVYRSDTYGGQTRCRLVAGYGGWRKTVPSQGYGSSSGVKASAVLQDAATACGEQLGPLPGGSVGPSWTRPGDVASVTLWDLVAVGVIPAWYVDAVGVTQVQTWPASTVGTPFTVTDHRPDEGVVTIATEDYASWMPGVSFTSPLLDGQFVSAGVEYRFDAEGQFRLDILTGQGNRVASSLEAVIARQIEPLRFFGRYEYSISAPTPQTVDVTPTDKGLGVPEYQMVPLTSDSIADYDPPAGGLCHVQFVNGLRSRPIVVWTDGDATSAQLLGGSVPVALQGSTCTVLWPGAIPVDGVITPPGSLFKGMLTIASAAIGQITTGSSKVSAPQ